MISLPFTISSIVLIVACFISKIQYSSTYMAIAIHAFLGPIETASLVTTLVLYVQSNEPKFSIKILFIAALALIIMLNFIAFVIQTPLIAQDRKFLKWLRRRDFQKSTQFNLHWFYFISVFSLFSNYKFKALLFSRLFSFDCLKCQLEGLQKFKLFNIFLFLGLVPQIIVLYCAWVQVLYIDSSQTIFSSLVDIIIIFLANIVFSLLSVIKQRDFFKDQIDGIPINKVIDLAQQSFQASQTSVKIGAIANGYSLEDIIQVNQMAYESTKRDVVNLNAPTKIEDQDQQKIDMEGFSQENTVTDRYSQNKNVQEQIRRHKESRISSSKTEKAEETHNILMVDQYFSSGSENNQNELEYSQANQFNQNPKVQINRKTQILEEPQLFSSYQGLIQEKIDLNKVKKVNLADYLIKAEKEMQIQKIKNQSSLKYDIVDLETKYDKMECKATEVGRYTSQVINQQSIESLPQDQTFFVDNQSSINFRSEPPGAKCSKHTTHTHQLQPSLFQNAIQKIVTKHNSPKKDIQQKQIQRRNRQISIKKTQIRLNEDHQQKAVTNRSKQKIKSVYNHPIKSLQNHKANQSPNQRIDYQQQDLNQQKKNSKSLNREHLKIKIVNDSSSQIKSIEKQEDSGNSRAFNTIREDDFFKQFLKQQDVTEEKQEVVKEFKRSIPQSLTFFPQKKKQEVELHGSDQPNFPPKKPTASIMQKLKQRFSAKSRQKTQVSLSNGIFHRSSKSASRNKSSESKRNHFDSNLRRKQSTQINRSENYFSQDKPKKYSLQKIYLQKLTR